MEAHNDLLNHHRWYTVMVGTDLFGEWTVTMRYGRRGRGGNERHASAATREGAAGLVRQCLARRSSAPRRIGCPYRLTAVDADPGIELDEWLSRVGVCECD